MLRLWFVGVAVAVVGVSVWGFTTQVVGTHVTACGVDSQGAYAKVRLNNLLGGVPDQDVYVCSAWMVGGMRKARRV